MRIFSSSSKICLTVVLAFILFTVLWASQVCGLVFNINLGKNYQFWIFPLFLFLFLLFLILPFYLCYSFGSCHIVLGYSFLCSLVSEYLGISAYLCYWFWFNSFVVRVQGFPDGASGKESICQCWRCKRLRFDPWVWKIPGSRKWHHSTILAWKIPWTEESSRLQYLGPQRVDTTESEYTFCKISIPGNGPKFVL